MLYCSHNDIATSDAPKPSTMSVVEGFFYTNYLSLAGVSSANCVYQVNAESALVEGPQLMAQ
ncbi:MAG: hypothetical protein LKE89_06565 [Lactobacillaceae bacterium]|jgi:hypothetical protein|nr:hypothetical protein [Lactobacillaceae bacterium]